MVCKLAENRNVEEVTQQKGQWMSLGTGEITIDSAADECFPPIGEGGALEARACKRNILLKAANGHSMLHQGEKEVTSRDQESGEVLGMTFQVTQVRKPLAAVWRLAEKGNVIQFGQEESQCFVHNLKTGRKMQLHKECWGDDGWREGSEEDD